MMTARPGAGRASPLTIDHRQAGHLRAWPGPMVALMAVDANIRRTARHPAVDVAEARPAWQSPRDRTSGRHQIRERSRYTPCRLEFSSLSAGAQRDVDIDPGSGGRPGVDSDPPLDQVQPFPHAHQP